MIERGVGLPAVDVTRHRAHLLRRLEELEQVNGPMATRKHAEWRRMLPRFVTEVVRRLQAGLAAGLDAEGFAGLVDTAIDLALDLQPEAGPSGIRKLELLHIAFQARVAARETRGVPDLDRYAFEVRLVRTDSGTRLTRAGRAWLATPGEDAIRLLLALEAIQSTGPLDAFRLAPISAQVLVNTPRGILYEDPDFLYPAHMGTLERLEELGLLNVMYGGPSPSYELTERGARLLGEVASGDSVWAVAANALVEEERSASIGALVPALERRDERQLSELAAREARLVAHEVRNALAPVRVQLDRMYSALARSRAQFDPSPFRETIDAGVARVFAFVESRLQLASVVEAAAEPFEVDPAILEAIDRNAETRLAAGGARVRGSRHSFVIAVIGEMIRNAQHAHPNAFDLVVRVSSTRRNGWVVVQVEDNGPGVAEEFEARIFERGFSTGGGSGQGLALAKEIVESMGGSIRVDRGQLGGARFTIELPVATTEVGS